MPHPVNLSNVNITIQQFNDISSGTYNAGEVRLNGNNRLKKINHHIVFTGSNDVSISHAEVIAIKNAFIQALQNSGVNGENLMKVRQELGLAPKGPSDVTMRERSMKPLSRQQIREILDRNASIINQTVGEGTIRTYDQIHARYSNEERRTQKQTRNTTDSLTQHQRRINEQGQFALLGAIVSGDVDYFLGRNRTIVKETLTQLKQSLLENPNGNNDQEGQITWRDAQTGVVLKYATGMSKADFINKLDDLIMRYAENAEPKQAEIDARNEFRALKTTADLNTWLNKQSTLPDGELKIRAALILLLQNRNINSHQQLALVNRLSDADGRAFINAAIRVPNTVKGDHFLHTEVIREILARADQDIPEDRQAFIPALSNQRFNTLISSKFSGYSPENTPVRFNAMLNTLFTQMKQKFGENEFPPNFSPESLYTTWGRAVDRDNPNAPRITPEAMLARITNDATENAARLVVTNKTRAILAQMGADQGLALGISTSYLRGNPAIMTRLKEAANPEEVQVILNEITDAIQEKARVQLLCKDLKNQMDAKCRELFARAKGISITSIPEGSINFSTATLKAEGLSSKILAGEVVVNNDEEILAAYEQLAQTHVNKLITALQQVENLANVSDAAKAKLAAHLLRSNKPDQFNFQKIVDFSKQIQMRSVVQSITEAPMDETMAFLDATMNNITAFAQDHFRQMGVQGIGGAEIGEIRNLVLSLAITETPNAAEKLTEFASRPAVQDYVNANPINPLTYVEPYYTTNQSVPSIHARIPVLQEMQRQFAPNGNATQQALGMGYLQSELKMLQTTAEMVQAATGCTVEEAINAALNPSSPGRRLASYGGRFMESADNFKKGLSLMHSFEIWFQQSTAQVTAAQNNHQMPANASLTVRNANNIFLKAEALTAYEKFIFEEIAVNKQIDLEETNLEELFGMDGNPAMRFVARGYINSATLALAQIPPEKRHLIYSVFDELAPVRGTHGSNETNNTGINNLNLHIISRVLRNYDVYAEMARTRQLTRTNILNAMFPDINNAANMTNRQLNDHFASIMMTQVMPNQLGNNPELIQPVFELMQRQGATLDEAIHSVMFNAPMNVESRLPSASCAIEQLNGTATSGRNALLIDLNRPANPSYIANEQDVIEDHDNNCVFKFTFPDNTVLKSKNGAVNDPAVVQADTAIVDKIAEFCGGNVHPNQLNALYYHLAQSGLAPIDRALIQYGIKTTEHTPVSFTLERNMETGLVTVHAQQPDGFPFQFHWDITVDINGMVTLSSLVVENAPEVQPQNQA